MNPPPESSLAPHLNPPPQGGRKEGGEERRRGRMLTGMVFALGLLFAVRNPGWATDSIGTLALTVRLYIDNMGPAAITNLTAMAGSSDGQILLTWTSPGDDGTATMVDVSGAADLYFIRRATFPVTNFPLATRATDWWNHPNTIAISGVPVPAVLGNTQNLLVSGLTPGVTYYFGMRTEDERANISDFDSGTSAPPQANLIAPAYAPNAISNLTALSGVLDGDVLLSWSTPGDDGTVGTLPVGSLYRIRRSTNPITNFALAPSPFFETVVSTSAIPPTTNASLTLTGLNPGTSYFFAIVTRDENAAESYWSTGAFVNTASSSAAQDLALSAPSGLSVLSTFISSVTLTWTNPSAPVSIDDRSLYRVYRATYNFAAITDSNVSLATFAPHPSASVSVTGLASEGLFFFRVSAVDLGDQGNGLFSLALESAVSVSTQTTLPRVPPSGVSNLTALTFVDGEVRLEWTSPGDDGVTGTISGGEFVIKYSTVSIIRSGDFDSPGATLTVTTVTIPISSLAPLTATNYVIPGLALNVTYYFAIKTRDEVAGNFSVWNSSRDVAGVNILAWIYLAGVPPNGISNLTALAGVLDGDVLLSWSTPGDDGTVGTLPVGSLYRIRRSTNPITNFASPPSPFFETAVSTSAIPPTTNASLTLTGLNPGTSYFFAIVTRDEAGVESSWSTGAFVNTAYEEAAQDIALSAPSGLSVLSTFVSSVTLTWTNPSAPVSIDDRSLYRVYQATYNFSATTDPNVSLATSTPHPSTSVTVTGLAQVTIYFFRASARDLGDQGNGLFSLVLESGVSLSTQSRTGALTPPAGISNLTALTATFSSILLQWSAPGDVEGAQGLPAGSLYRIRYSSVSVIRLADFDSPPSTMAVLTQDISTGPVTIGEAQSTTIAGLLFDTSYFFAIKTRGQAGLFSVWNSSIDVALVNVAASTRTLPFVDASGPSAITDLTASTTTLSLGEIRLSWTAPGDDGTAGVATTYILRRATFPVTDFPLATRATDWWSTATDVLGEPAPLVSGSAQSMIVTGLAVGTTYYFGIRTQDEIPNISDFDAKTSLPPQANSLPAGDSFAPSAITNLSALLTGAVEGEIRLTWNAPGDDGTVGTASLYIIRRATWSALAGDATGWWNNSNAVTLSGPPAPLISGSTQAMTVAGLTLGTTYYFGIRAEDDQGNISDFDMGVSTPALQARSMPQSDVTAPATVSDFNILSVSTYSATIRWTTPGDDGAGSSSYDANGRAEDVTIKWSTASMTLADFLAVGASSTSVRVASSSGTIETVVITGLQQATSYFIVLRYRDEVPNFSSLSNQPSQRINDNLPPTAPLFFIATPRPDLGNAIALSWTNPPESDFSGIRILARTDQFPTGPADPAARLVATTAVGQTAALDTGLTGGATYYYGAFSFDSGFLFSSASTATAISPQPLDTTKPLEPRGLDSSRASDGSSFTLTWLPVEKNVNGTTANDLVSYRVYRSTPFFEPKALFATVSSTLTTFTDGTIAGETFHYYVTALDFSGNESTRSVVMGSSADMMMFVLAPDNPSTMMQIPKTMRDGMKKENNSFGDDLWLTVERLTDEEIGRRLRVYKVKVMMAKSNQEPAGFIFPAKDPQMMISYADAVKGGMILGGAPSMASQVNLSLAEAPNQLALFWFNGNEWLKLGGDVDTANRVVSMKTDRAGKFALVQSLRATEFTLGTIYPRIFSPNGDGWNDICTFVFENPKDASAEGKIFDIGGGFVANMKAGGLPDTLVWDGKDSSGKTVSAGIYLYQIKAEGKNLTGTVVVAK